jgi:hypothetical protein
VQEGQYPHPAGQHWAEPDLEQAKSHVLALLDDPERGRAIGQAAGIHMRRYFSHRARGVSYMTRLAEVDPSLV